TRNRHRNCAVDLSGIRRSRDRWARSTKRNSTARAWLSARGGYHREQGADDAEMDSAADDRADVARVRKGNPRGAGQSVQISASVFSTMALSAFRYSAPNNPT